MISVKVEVCVSEGRRESECERERERVRKGVWQCGRCGSLFDWLNGYYKQSKGRIEEEYGVKGNRREEKEERGERESGYWYPVREFERQVGKNQPGGVKRVFLLGNRGGTGRSNQKRGERKKNNRSVISQRHHQQPLDMTCYQHAMPSPQLTST